MTRQCVLVGITLVLAMSTLAAEPIHSALSCGKIGVVGGLGAGTDLTRYTIDTAKFPNALCNDGTPAIFYYAAATRAEDQGKWIIFLQGGGSCTSGQLCAQRWCSIDTNYGMDKMSSAFSKAQIRGVGFLSPDARNRFRTWNRVLVYYCSSDQWSGTKANTVSATAQSGATVEYGIQFRGAQIVDAVIDTLRNAAPGGRRRAVGHSGPAVQEATPWPDLDLATHVIFAGSSGGGNGAKNNADRVGARLRANNPSLADYRVVIDASSPPLTTGMDYTPTTWCQESPSGCTYESFTRGLYEAVDVSLYAARGDESCIAYHRGREPGEWICNDKEHVMWHHITTPMFIHQDLQDPSVAKGFVETNLGDATAFALGIDAVIRNPPAPEEPRGAPHGAFTLQCMTHEAFTTDTDVFNIRVNGLTYNETVWNWWSGAQPQRVLATYSGTPGKVAGCPAD